MNTARPLALDLCCGPGGWTQGLIATGWDVISIDIDEQWRPYYIAAPVNRGFLREDVRNIWIVKRYQTMAAIRTHDTEWTVPRIELVVASPPCPEFSRHDQPWTRAKNPPPPDQSIWRACERIAREAEAPLVLEKVRGAMKFMGPAAWHCGPYYLWGNVPALMPKLRFGPKRGPAPAGAIRSKSSRSSEALAARVKIPFEIAWHIGNVLHPANSEREAS